MQQTPKPSGRIGARATARASLRLSYRDTLRRGASTVGLLAVLVLALSVLGARAPVAHAASGNASAAIGFIEGAQNPDGGFGEHQRSHSDPTSSLWAATALLAAGRNPADEALRNDTTLDEYLSSHSSAYRSLYDLGLLAMVEAAAAGSSYGHPGARLPGMLTAGAIRSEPGGAALAILGLLASGAPSDREAAVSAARQLLSSATNDGGWGSNGLSDSASTALALQAIAAAGVGNANTPAVRAGVNYLQRAQSNDGSIAASTRTDLTIASGSVTATAFTIQALRALALPPLRTSTGTSVLQGLTQYQQQSSGGLTSDGSLYSQVPPSIIETAQAFPAFDGVTFPLAVVARSKNGPPRGGSGHGKGSHGGSGSAAQGLSGATGTTNSGAFAQATATGSTTTTSSSGQPGSGGRHRAAAGHRAANQNQGSTAGGTAVSGEQVAGAKPPALVGAAARGAGGLSAAERATLALLALLLGCIALGAWLDSRPPRSDGRSRSAALVAGAAAGMAALRARGSLVPIAVIVVGLALISFPLATHMFKRGPEGQRMISAFAPHMQEARLAAYRSDVGVLQAGFSQAANRAPSLLAPGRPASVAREQLQRAAPQLAEFDQGWPASYARLSGLLATIESNRARYEAVAALPRFGALPWFFVVPGAMLALLGALAVARPGRWRNLRWAVLAVAVLLIAAPTVTGMWSRARQGQEMVAAFRSIETRSLVTAVQNDFSSITTGEGALSGELVPALEARGLSTARIDRAIPALASLEARWIAILQNLTPLIGVMNDNLGNYAAVASLPPFGTLPFIFAAAGLLAAALVALSFADGSALRARVRRADPATPGPLPGTAAGPPPAGEVPLPAAGAAPQVDVPLPAAGAASLVGVPQPAASAASPEEGAHVLLRDPLTALAQKVPPLDDTPDPSQGAACAVD